MFRWLFGGGGVSNNTISPAQLLMLAFGISRSLDFRPAETGVEVIFTAPDYAEQLYQLLQNRQVAATQSGSTVLVPYDSIEGEFSFDEDG
ncbi:MAG: hypothetical protein AAFW84_30330 [Cyanobacteria bacterium J06635_15]